VHVGGRKGERNENDREGEMKEDISGEERIVQKARMMTRNVEEDKMVLIILLCCYNSNIIETRQF
jgi:hypothetical protein